MQHKSVLRKLSRTSVMPGLEQIENKIKQNNRIEKIHFLHFLHFFCIVALGQFVWSIATTVTPPMKYAQLNVGFTCAGCSVYYEA